jgi:hypothetical protein
MDAIDRMVGDPLEDVMQFISGEPYCIPNDHHATCTSNTAGS